jgi:dTDP-4-dehydrorhamnose 3,5-epimerase
MMINESIKGVSISPLKIINTKGGDVLHALKSHEDHFQGFGEAYFSKIESGAIKAWKRHQKMTLNLIVPIGAIKFVIYDDREDSKTKGCFQSVKLSEENYKRLNIPPMLWVGFYGQGEGLNMLLNLANIPHHPEESDHMDIAGIEYDWN